MGRLILVIAALALHLYVLIDLVRSPSGEVRLLPKWLWFLVWLLPIAGPLCYLLAGQPRVERGQGGGGGGGGGITGGPRPRGPVAPDDDPEFLKRLDEQSWAARMERLRRERGTRGGPPSGQEQRPIDPAPGPESPAEGPDDHVLPSPDEAPGEGATR
ncbi:MAG TPA: PLD nuclease N-terminal domain-containing protein [Candidatus Nanopelagicales bacterium]